jgi:hypothetical protein
MSSGDRGQHDLRDYEPTPKEIRERCEAIQREWSDKEREERIAYKNAPFLIHRLFGVKVSIGERVSELIGQDG